MSDVKMEPKPEAGVDTPAEDDIIVPCRGGCGKWMVVQHPSHVRGGGAFVDGELREWKPTPEWVEAEAERLASGVSSCLSCGPVVLSDEEQAAHDAETERIQALRDFS